MPQIFRVGGCVRDEILGVKSKDIDFTFILDDLNQTVESGFQSMTDWMQTEGFTVFLSTPSCFTIRAKFPKTSVHSNLTADFVMARKEVGYIAGTRTPILELGTLADDLVRRDFTLNAMAQAEDVTIIDLFGGKEDLAAGILRTPVDAMTTMMDDPLRILRALRFSITKGFTIHEDIWKAMRQRDILEKLALVVSQERIRDEAFKMFKFDTVGTMMLFGEVEQSIPDFIRLVFSNGLWLCPTFKL